MEDVQIFQPRQVQKHASQINCIEVLNVRWIRR